MMNIGPVSETKTLDFPPSAERAGARVTKEVKDLALAPIIPTGLSEVGAAGPDFLFDSDVMLPRVAHVGPVQGYVCEPMS